MIALAQQSNILDEVIHGSALDVLRSMPDNSVDAIVCDPPAGISFMNKTFDSDRGGRDFWIAWLRKIMAEALRVLKPGGHAFVWALPRTSHWTGIALEDAGWEIREKCYHIFGSGFPKSKNLGNGLGTALKPAVEEWILARKPLSEPTIAANVLKWGTGALAIDKCRVGNESTIRHNHTNGIWASEQQENVHGSTQGRFPSNLLLSHSVWCVPNGVKKVKQQGGHGEATRQAVLHRKNVYGKMEGHVHAYCDSEGMEQVEDWLCDESCPIRLLDEQSGILHARGNKTPTKQGKGMFFPEGGYLSPVNSGDSGGSSRYFQRFSPFIYQAKASRSERNRGCEGLPEKANRINAPRSSEGEKFSPSSNNHPTVKPLALCRYLVRMITPPGGIVLDCFAGSGSTLVAAIHEGMHFIGVEMNDTPEEPYCTIARARIEQAFRDAGKPDAPVPPAEEWECAEDCPIAALDKQSGIRKSDVPTAGKSPSTLNAYGQYKKRSLVGYDDRGGASRFFTNLVQDGMFDEVQS